MNTQGPDSGDESPLETAKRLHQEGALEAARVAYAAVLAAAPTDAEANFRLGILELQEQRYDEAVARLRKALAARPREVRFLTGLGLAAAQAGYWEAALEAFSTAAAEDPACVDALVGRGSALQSLHRYREASTAYDAALALDDSLADVLLNRGYCAVQVGTLLDAVIAYRRVLVLRPGDVAAAGNLGAVLLDVGDIAGALDILRTAWQRDPVSIQAAVNFGVALCRAARWREAVEVLTAARARNAAHADLAYNLGVAYAGLGEHARAVAQYGDALALRPTHVDTLVNLGNSLQELGEADAAARAYEAALALNPALAVAYNNLGCLERIRGRIDAAEALLRRGLAIDPQHAPLHSNLGTTLKDAGDLDAAIGCFRRAIDIDPGYQEAHANLAYSLSFQLDDAAAILAECRRWNERFALPLRTTARPNANDRSATRRLRIGYVSPDFREHCQALFMLPLLASHDRTAVEVYCYSSVRRPDHYTAELRRLADAWREVAALDDAALAEQIRADGIDVLVDLTMHMSYSRALVFARKPAPVQVAWLAYPGTTGNWAIDFRISDPRLDPEGADEFYSERTLRLADAFWCYHPLTDGPPVNALPATVAGEVTLGCLNNPCKLTARTLELWARVMQALPAARLVLMAPEGRHRDQLAARFAAAGIAPSRVAFVPFQPRLRYLETYHAIDIGLDTLPYNGHTTSLDAFWMGVPVVTRVGSTCAGRGGLSQLVQLGLAELAATTDEDYVGAVVRLATDLDSLRELRAALRERLVASPLMDAPRFARALEGAYREAWRLAYADAPAGH